MSFHVKFGKNEVKQEGFLAAWPVQVANVSKAKSLSVTTFVLCPLLRVRRIHRLLNQRERVCFSGKGVCTFILFFDQTHFDARNKRPEYPVPLAFFPIADRPGPTAAFTALSSEVSLSLSSLCYSIKQRCLSTGCKRNHL